MCGHWVELLEGRTLLSALALSGSDPSDGHEAQQASSLAAFAAASSVRPTQAALPNIPVSEVRDFRIAIPDDASPDHGEELAEPTKLWPVNLTARLDLRFTNPSATAASLPTVTKVNLFSRTGSRVALASVAVPRIPPGRAFHLSRQIRLPADLPWDFTGSAFLVVLGGKVFPNAGTEVVMADPRRPWAVEGPAFESEQAGRDYLTKHGWVSVGVGHSLGDGGYMKQLAGSAVRSRYTGNSLSPSAFRQHADVKLIGDQWRVITQGSDTAGEPNPYAFFLFDPGGYDYVREWHYRF